MEEFSAPFFRAEFAEQLATSQLGTTVVMVSAWMGDGRLLPYTLWFHFLGVDGGLALFGVIKCATCL